MGKVFKKVVSAPVSAVKAVGGALGGALDVPVLGDIMKIGSNFIPGAGPLISMGLEAFDQFTGNEAKARSSGFNPTSWGAMAANPLAMALMQKQSQNQNPSQANFSMMPGLSGELDPSYNYLTQADMRTYGTMNEYADLFRGLSDTYGGYQDRAFDIYEQSITGDKGTLDWDQIGGIANRMAEAQNKWMTQGTAGTEGSIQGDIQKALGSSVQSGFGVGGGMLGNALTNTFSRIAQTNIESADRNLGTIGGIEAQNLASLRQSALAGLQNFTGAQLGALESSYGAATGAEEMLYGRDQENFMRQFNRRISPELEKHIRYVPWWERQLQTMGEMGAAQIGGALPDIFGKGLGWLGGILGGGTPNYINVQNTTPPGEAPMTWDWWNNKNDTTSNLPWL